MRTTPSCALTGIFTRLTLSSLDTQRAVDQHHGHMTPITEAGRHFPPLLASMALECHTVPSPGGQRDATRPPARKIYDHAEPVIVWTLYGHKTRPNNPREPQTTSVHIHENRR